MLYSCYSPSGLTNSDHFCISTTDGASKVKEAHSLAEGCKSRPGMRGGVIRGIAAAAFIGAVSILLVYVTQRHQNWATASSLSTNPCPLSPITIVSQIPQDSAQTSQAYFDCFAWQEFIGLNWDADPTRAGAPDPSASPAEFGKPLDLAPPVFETYADALDVFLPGATTPQPWGTVAPSPCAIHGMVARRDRRLLRMASIIAPDFQGMSGVKQAFPGSGPSWLADRDGDLVWYQILIDKDEFKYIVNKQYYNADRQLQALTSDERIDLPAGIPGGSLGAIEVKAAWLPITDPSRRSHYRMQQTIVLDSDKTCHSVSVGLVALHIIHKTQSQPTWIWSTFEQVENAPYPGATSSNGFVFNRPNCQPSPIPASCVLGKNGMQTSCAANIPPAYTPVSYFAKAETCPVYPVQVAEGRPPDPVAAVVNAYAQALIHAQNAASVYQYYRLVNVLWASNSSDPNGWPSPPVAPVVVSGITPPKTQPVANAATETYAQGMTCLACHSSARIAEASNDSRWKPYFSDFSFIMSQAHTPAPVARP